MFLSSTAQIHFEIKKINVDSLQLIILGLDGREKADAMNKLSGAYWDNDSDSSISKAKRAITISEELNYQKGLANGLFNLGNAYYALIFI